MSNCSRINDKTGDKTKTFIINSSVKNMDKKINECNSDLNNKIANIHKKFKGDLNSKILEMVNKNKKDIKTCVLERQANDKDILKINSVLQSNQELLKQLLNRCEYLEEHINNIKMKQKEDVMKKELESIVEEKEEEEIEN